MLDETTVTGKVIVAAITLAAGQSWPSVSLRAIADAAGVTLADMREHGLADKSDILIGLVGAVDRHVLTSAPTPDLSQSPRDRLFEVVMCRLDALEPYKAGLKSVAKTSPLDFRLCRHALASQAWMLEAGGISADGVLGGIKAAGLATVYGQVLRGWLDDDDPGLARTMAALDRRLRGGERAVAGLDEATKSGRRICAMLTGLLERRRGAREPKASANDPATNGPSGEAPAVDFPNPSPGSA
jgi:ubiquinone biosynthesis protein COQ9